MTKGQTKSVFRLWTQNSCVIMGNGGGGQGNDLIGN